MAHTVVYGGGFAAVAAAAKAASNASNKTVVLIVPYPTAKLGGIATIGGQNYWDTRGWNGTHPQRGTFAYWYGETGSFYNTDTMASLLHSNLAKYSNVVIRYCFDVTSVVTATSPFRITAVNLKNIYRDTDGNIKWGTTTSVEYGTIFIDASEEGRLARIVNSAVTTGRYDWPINYLDNIEKNAYGVGRQQAATLMFKMTGITPGTYSDMNFTMDSKTGIKGCWGGRNTYKNNATVKDFNNTYGSQGYILKPINAAQNGLNSSEWWINAFLIFNVDGRANYRDKNTAMYPIHVLSGNKTTDEAWIAARNFLKNTATFLTAIRQFDGFGSADFVTDSNGYPVVGDMLYLRETVHMSIDSQDRTNQSEDNYHITTAESNNAGNSPITGTDTSNHYDRIGLSYYNADVHPYKYTDLKDNAGNYLWAEESWDKMRPDLNITGSSPANPVYVPYQALTTGYVANLLLPGYAVGVSSFSWGETRVFPNLSVLGDAAGVAAAYCLNNNKQPLYLNHSDVSVIQNTLINSAEARIDK